MHKEADAHSGYQSPTISVSMLRGILQMWELRRLLSFLRSAAVGVPTGCSEIVIQEPGFCCTRANNAHTHSMLL